MHGLVVGMARWGAACCVFACMRFLVLLCWCVCDQGCDSDSESGENSEELESEEDEVRRGESAPMLRI